MIYSPFLNFLDKDPSMCVGVGVKWAELVVVHGRRSCKLRKIDQYGSGYPLVLGPCRPSHKMRPSE